MEKTHASLLESVSRSFYLSIRFLPKAMQEPIALGYLLARFTDTIADTSMIEGPLRSDLLEKIQESLEQRSKLDWNPETVSSQVENEGERELVLRSGEMFNWLYSIEETNQKLIVEVLKTILRGQRWDAEISEKGGLNGCESADDLLRYTYEVAGCVGEFWTWVGFVNLGDRFADRENLSDMLESGRKLGQALQLTNILRDLHEDLPNGRCYLPIDELRAAGWNGESEITSAILDPVFERWTGICRDFLDQSEFYIAKVEDPRVRFSTRLPKLLAEATVDRLQKSGCEVVMNQRIRISRSDVWKKAGQAIFF